MLRSSPSLAAHGFRHAFSTRVGGVSAPPFDSLNLARNVGDEPERVLENHRRLALAVGYEVDRLVEVTQVHGSLCLAVDGLARAGEIDVARVRREEADALASARAGLALGVRTADCLPLLLADPETRSVAAVHAGWRGAVAGVVPAAIACLRAAPRVSPPSLLAAIGPHIRSASFEVGGEVQEAFERAFAGLEGAEARASAVARMGPLVTRRDGRAHVSLATLVVAQLLGAGLRLERIDDVGGDTFAEPSTFHSYRRDGARSGRQLSVIVAG